MWGERAGASKPYIRFRVAHVVTTTPLKVPCPLDSWPKQVGPPARCRGGRYSSTALITYGSVRSRKNR